MQKELNPDVERLARVWTDGHCIEIGDFEVPEFLELRTTGKNADYFGAINLSMSAEFAIALGMSLIDLGEIKRTQNSKK